MHTTMECPTRVAIPTAIAMTLKSIPILTIRTRIIGTSIRLPKLTAGFQRWSRPQCETMAIELTERRA